MKKYFGSNTVKKNIVVKNIIYILCLFISIFAFGQEVYATVEYSCPAGFEVSGDKCIKITESYKDNGTNYCPQDAGELKGENCELIIDATKSEIEDEGNQDNNFNLGFDDPYKEIGSNDVNCDTLGTLRKDLNSVFNIIKIVAPILVIVFSIYDFIKAVAGKVEGEMKKAFTKLLKRILFAIIIFFLPTLLDYFLGLVNEGYTTCINS